MRGRTSDGGHFDGYEQFRPGDPGYDEMFPVASENRVEEDEQPERRIDPDTVSRLFHEAGLDRPRADDG
ncbi:hypothetical protein [Nocardia wallacei]|uniref:hypothetical protein n=1 Tax=Nocardia wallacei TaxID=480035 RepID=UPI00245783CD|nr:hypothetical protein [Nocardia wallacei]